MFPWFIAREANPGFDALANEDSNGGPKDAAGSPGLARRAS
jgi:hypothetical protein